MNRQPRELVIKNGDTSLTLRLDGDFYTLFTLNENDTQQTTIFLDLKSKDAERISKWFSQYAKFAKETLEQ